MISVYFIRVHVRQTQKTAEGLKLPIQTCHALGIRLERVLLNQDL